MIIEKNKGNVSNVLVANCFQIWSFHDGKYYNGIKEGTNQIQRDPMILIKNSFGPLRIALKFANFVFYYLITLNQISN